MKINEIIAVLKMNMVDGKLTKGQIIGGLKMLDQKIIDDPNFARSLVEFIMKRNEIHDFSITDLEQAPDCGIGKKHLNKNWTFRHYTNEKFNSLNSLAALEAKGINAGKNTNARDWEELGNQGFVFGLISIDGKIPKRTWLSSFKYYAEYSLSNITSIWVSGDMLDGKGRSQASYQGTGTDIIAQLSKMLGFINQDVVNVIDSKFGGILEAKIPPPVLSAIKEPEWIAI